MTVIICIDIERTDVPFICKTLGCHPVASADHFSPEALANVDLVEEISIGGESNCTKVTCFFLSDITTHSLILVYWNSKCRKDCFCSHPSFQRKSPRRGKILVFYADNYQMNYRLIDQSTMLSAFSDALSRSELL